MYWENTFVNKTLAWLMELCPSMFNCSIQELGAIKRKNSPFVSVRLIVCDNTIYCGLNFFDKKNIITVTIAPLLCSVLQVILNAFAIYDVFFKASHIPSIKAFLSNEVPVVCVKPN